jgi:hypothetical protein
LFLTMHVANKEVKIEVDLMPDFHGANEFKEFPFEMILSAADKSFTVVGYMSKKELESLRAQADGALQDHDRLEVEKHL